MWGTRRGEGARLRRWERPLVEEICRLTAVGANGPEGVGSLRKSDPHPAARKSTQAQVEGGIRYASFAADDVATVRRQLEV